MDIKEQVHMTVQNVSGDVMNLFFLLTEQLCIQHTEQTRLAHLEGL